MKVLVVGCGLIGTSIALRLSERGNELWLSDTNKNNLELAQDLIGDCGPTPEIFDLIVIATPIDAIPGILKNLKSYDKKSTVIDIGGLKSKLLHEVEDFPEIAEIFVSAHPMAGREFTGPASARADLFEGRAWLISPTSKTKLENLIKAKEIGEILGATAYEVSPEEHDQIIAAVSHMPQILSSLMGNLLMAESESSLNFSGQGLRDVSRLADSDPTMWSQLILANSEKLLPQIKTAIDLLKKLQSDLSTSDSTGISKFFVDGKAGRSRIPGKHGAKARDYAYLPVVIDDKPGQLAKIFDECAECSVNVEDLTIEHSPNQQTGLITLALSQGDAQKLKKHMSSKGWLAQEIHS